LGVTTRVGLSTVAFACKKKQTKSFNKASIPNARETLERHAELDSASAVMKTSLGHKAVIFSIRLEVPLWG